MSNLKKSFLMGTAAAGTALLASAFFSILAVHAACTNPSTIPTGFASPCPVFSLSNASVTQAQSLTLSATPQAGTDYIYTTAYVSNGTTWNPYTLSGNNAYPSYSSALASLTLSSTQLSALSLGTHYAVVWDWLWDATAGCYKGPGLNQCNTGAWRVQSFSITSSYAYSQSSYYAYSQGSYYAYSQSAYTSSTNLALGILPTASAAFSSGSASQITDNDLNTANWVSIGSGGAQWIKLDLGNTYSLTDIKVWHYYGDGRTYHDVIVQVSNDATYASGVTTVFSNDTNNSAGQGIGGNAEYAETSLGKDIAFPAVSARYVRLWTNGSTANVDNHYVEVEVFGTGGTYAYSQSSYYSYSQSAYVSYAYSQSTYYAYSQSAYTSGTVYNVKTSACGPSGTNAAGNGTTDDGGVIRSCIGHLSSGDKLLFPSGTYLVSGEIDLVGKNNITVDGSSNTATIKGNFSGGSLFVVGNTAFGGQRGTGIALSATANELSTSFTTVSSLGVNPGDYVHLIEGGQGNWNGNNPRACDPAGCRGEVLKVASVNGNTVTVTTALHDTYVPNGGVFSGDGGSTSCSSSNAGNCATAYKLLNPVTAVTVQNINLNGNGTVGNGMVMDETMDSTVSGVGTTGFKYISMFSEGNFNTAWNNVTATNNGNTDSCPPAQEGTGMYFFRVGNPSANGITVSNMVPGTCAETFGIEFTDGVANGTFTNITVDATGAYGRPFKSNALRYSTFNSFTVKNSPAVNNGVSPEYWTSHNTFNNCVVTNNGGTGTGTGSAGIAFFGDYNQYNTFNNCTISGNGNIQVADGPDPVTGPTDIHNTISGGTITGSNSVAPVLYLGVPNFTVSGVTIKGPGTQGLVMDRSSANDCINNNTFSNSTGLTAAISSNSNTNVGSGNILNGLSSNLTPGTCP